MYLLSPNSYPSVRSLFSPLEIHLVIDAILKGRAKGQIYVDDRTRPRAALARRRHRFYLALENVDAGTSLLAYWSEVLYPQAQAAGQEMYVLYAASDRWTPLIEETLAAREPIPAPRQYLATATQEQRDLPSLPAGYRIIPASRALRQDAGLQHRDELYEEVLSEHASIEAFQRDSFGVCALHGEREIAGWCLAEYNNANRCEIGIETRPAHQRRGLGTAMTVALIAQARARGLEQVGWHSYTRNVPSIGTALKAGLHKVCDYPAYVGHYAR